MFVEAIPKVSRVRPRGEDIRRFILENIEKHPRDVSNVTSGHFKITRQAVNKHLQRLFAEHAISELGNTRSRVYSLAPLLESQKAYVISPELAEDLVWKNDVSPVIGQLPENVLDIWRYGFTEMLNNAKDHSGGTEIIVKISKTAVNTEMYITDNGIGIFKKIQDALNLLDERHAVLELAKGKLTTDPKRHTGEGIFFTSRMFDAFAVISGRTYWGHNFGQREDWIMDGEAVRDGTTILLKLSNHTARTERKIFDQYSSEGEFAFDRTVVPVALAQYGNDKLVSRSQAKRLLSRVELFKVVVFDFTGVQTIGQAFADELFRVFPNEHPNIEVLPIHHNSEVKRMIERARTRRAVAEEPATS